MKTKICVLAFYTLACLAVGVLLAKKIGYCACAWCGLPTVPLRKATTPEGHRVMREHLKRCAKAPYQAERPAGAPTPPYVDAARGTSELLAELNRRNKTVKTDRAQAPHCDDRVLHAPNTCQFCDEYPDMQIARILGNINFTGEGNPNKWACPAEYRRPVEKINRWPGNRPQPAGSPPIPQPF